MEPNVTPPLPHDAGASWLASMPSKIIWRAALVGAVSALPLPYPYWHQAKTAKDRLGPADLALLAPYL